MASDETAGTTPRNPARRALLLTAGAVAGGLAIGVQRFYRQRDRLAPPAADAAADDPRPFLTAWVRVGPDGRIAVQVPRQEMGQGIASTLALLVADEMDADPALVTFEQAAIDPVYVNATMIGDGIPFRPDDDGALARFASLSQFKLGEALGVQGTGGSTSLRDAWDPMRQAGAAARAMLLAAAAERLGQPAASLRVERGIVEHPASGRRATFGELASDAARQPIPRGVAPKDPSAYRYIGRPQPRLDIPPKVDGRAQFGIDIRVPGLRYAAIRQCPTFGGSVAHVDAARAMAYPGVVAIFDLPATSTSAAGVVAVAERSWQARAALADVEIRWNDGPHAGHDTTAQRARYVAALESAAARTYDEAGDVDRALSGGRALGADYVVPYLAHATLEPPNCTAVVRRDGSCDVWVGNQAPTLVRWFAARTADVRADRVRVHTPLLGGGFGRRFEQDVVVQAVAIARRLPDTPIQLIWSREEDLAHDVYRPMAAARFRATLDAKGLVSGWLHRVVGQSCTGSLTARLLPDAPSDLLKDKTTVEGAFDLPYALPNRRVEHVLTHEPVPVGYWRSVGHSYNAFFTECFIDECASAAGQDPVAFRRAHLGSAPRYRNVLDIVAAKAGWNLPPAPGVGRGVALAGSFRSIVAQVAEVELRGARVVVRRVVCVVDCGYAVNPAIVAAQMEGAIIFGLTAALHGEITLENGQVQQANFPTYDMVRLADSPQIEVHIVQSGIEHLGGIGEPGTPPIAPAVCNAIAALTGTRIRQLPIRLAPPA